MTKSNLISWNSKLIKPTTFFLMLALNFLSCGTESGSEDITEDSHDEEEAPSGNLENKGGSANPSSPVGPSSPGGGVSEIIDFFSDPKAKNAVDISAFKGKEFINSAGELTGLGIPGTMGKIVPFFGTCEKGFEDLNGFGLFSNFYNGEAGAKSVDHPIIPWADEMKVAYGTCSKEPFDNGKFNVMKCMEVYFQLFKCLQKPSKRSPFKSENHKYFSGFKSDWSAWWATNKKDLEDYSEGMTLSELKTAPLYSNETLKKKCGSVGSCVATFITHLSADGARNSGRLMVAVADSDDRKQRDVVMFKGLLKKFPKGHDYTNKLLATGNAILVEGNKWNDRFFGAKYNSAQKRFLGTSENKLGKMLMIIRYIRSQEMDDDNPFVEDVITQKAWTRKNQVSELLDASRLLP